MNQRRKSGRVGVRLSDQRAPGSGALPDGAARRPVWRVRAGRGAAVDDAIAEEVPVALVINDAPFVVMMATPCDFDDFALGFCLSEAVIDTAEKLLDVKIDRRLEGVVLDIKIPESSATKLASRQRGMEGRSGCGVCGARTLEQLVRVPLRVAPHAATDLSVVRRGLAALSAAQPLNAATGATHAAAWVDAAGTLVLLREDVGRHNALDKLIGSLHRQRIDLTHGVLLLTSRASYEMVMKAATTGIHTIAAISAPTALAIALAEQAGVTLIGFARGSDCVVYSHADGVIKD